MLVVVVTRHHRVSPAVSPMTAARGLETPAQPLTCMARNAMEPDRRTAIEYWQCDPVGSTNPFEGTPVMKTLAALLAVAALTLAATSADAKGCLKGAAVGGVAGHYAGHHAVLGAVAGCLYGRHHAKQQEMQQQQQGQAPAGQEKL
jgi:hypothetical protein